MRQERVHTVVYVYSTPGYGGEPAAITYAALLPSVPPPPDGIRKAWGMTDDASAEESAMETIRPGHLLLVSASRRR